MTVVSCEKLTFAHHRVATAVQLSLFQHFLQVFVKLQHFFGSPTRSGKNFVYGFSSLTMIGSQKEVLCGLTAKNIIFNKNYIILIIILNKIIILVSDRILMVDVFDHLQLTIICTETLLFRSVEKTNHLCWTKPFIQKLFVSKVSTNEKTDSKSQINVHNFNTKHLLASRLPASLMYSKAL